MGELMRRPSGPHGLGIYHHWAGVDDVGKKFFHIKNFGDLADAGHPGLWSGGPLVRHNRVTLVGLDGLAGQDLIDPRPVALWSKDEDVNGGRLAVEAIQRL